MTETVSSALSPMARWMPERARAWYEACAWPCGFNYLPATAVNSTEMWQAETFDPATIERELGWAREIGFNACRVFIQYLVWDADGDAFLSRFDRFLDIAARHGLSALPILFDDCAFAGKEPHLGPQDPPAPGIHNSGWTASPGRARVLNRSCRPRLREYVQNVIGRFANDDRVLAWDVYNEPGNGGMGDKSLPLLHTAFAWAREIGPSQPLTAGVWNTHADFAAMNEALLALSDVTSYHDYDAREKSEKRLAELQKLGRPLLCTEWMRRGFGSHFDSHLPLFRRERAACWFWGLVNGRTQTHYPWGSLPGAPAPERWFHDLLASDGTPHDETEIALIRQELQEAHAQ